MSPSQLQLLEDVSKQTNSSSIPPALFTQVEFTLFVKVSATYLILVTLLSIMGNGVILLVFVSNRGLRTRSNFFMANLAFCHLLTSLSSMPISLLTTLYSSPYDAIMCKMNLFAVLSLQGALSHTLMYFSIHIVFAIQTISKTSSTNENSALYSNHISENNHNSVIANHVNAVTSSLSHHSSTNENRKKYLSSSSNRPMLQVIISLFCAWVFGFLGGFGPMLEWGAIRKSSNCINWHSQHRIIPLFHTYYLFLGSVIIPALVIAVNLTRFYCCLLSTPRIKNAVSRNTDLSQYVRSIRAYVVVVFIFLFSWMPYFANAISETTKIKKIPWPGANSSLLIYCFIYFECGSFPIVMFFNNKNFRKAVSHLGKICRRHSSYEICDRSPTSTRRFQTEGGGLSNQQRQDRELQSVRVCSKGNSSGGASRQRKTSNGLRSSTGGGGGGSVSTGALHSNHLGFSSQNNALSVSSCSRLPAFGCSESTGPKHEILYKNPSKLKLADFEKIPPTQPVIFSSLGQDSVDSESEAEETLSGNLPPPAVVPINPFLSIGIGRSESSSAGFGGQMSTDRPFSFFRSQAIDNNAEGNENTYICNSNFRNPEKTDAGPFNDSLLSGDQLMAPKLNLSLSSQSLPHANVSQIRRKRIEFMLSGKTPKIHGSNFENLGKEDLFLQQQSSTQSYSTSPQLLQKMTSDIFDVDRPIKLQHAFSHFDDVTEEPNSVLNGNCLVQPGSASYRVKYRGPESRKKSNLKSTGRYVSLPEETFESKETYL